MRYRERLALCSVLSLFLNLAVLLAPWQQQAARGHVADAPLVLRLQERPSPAAVPPPEPPQVIETFADAHRPVETTNLLSDHNANAADAELHDGREPGPRLDEQGELVSMPMAPGPSPQAPPPHPIAREKERTAVEEAPEKRRSTDEEINALLEVVDAAEQTETSVEPQETREAPEEQPLLAAAAPFPAAAAPQPGRGRIDGRVIERGFTSFEALQDDVAAYYLHHVKPLIRRTWITTMLTRYTGSTRMVAEIEVAIAPDGRVAAATIVGSPMSRIYAALCRESVLKAGPFRPFPFRVPPEYRDENLVIHCTFQWQ